MSQNDSTADIGGQPTTIYVIALRTPGKPSSETIVPCVYFTSDGVRVPPNQIQTVAHSNSVTFQQRQDFPNAQARGDGEEIDPNVGLFAAVAKTLNGTSDLPRTFPAVGVGGFSSVNVPVLPGTKRGVVLIFRTPANGDAERLIATTDPEIRNGSAG